MSAASELPDPSRTAWVQHLSRMAGPVFDAMHAGRLKADMPIELGPHGHAQSRAETTHLEAIGRLLAGVAPWLESDAIPAEEQTVQHRFREAAIRGLEAAADPDSPEFVNWALGGQPIVDAAFLAHAFLRAPRRLWGALPSRTQTQILDHFRGLRTKCPGYSNWLLFGAMPEAFLQTLGEAWDPMRVDYALRQHMTWFKGDGVYGDGPEFHWDYYNSFVIQPMLLDVLAAVPGYGAWDSFRDPVRHRARRYAAILERLIGPDGSFPPLGRSLCYRCGAFQHLAQCASDGLLPDDLPPGQVRAALMAVIERTLDVPGTYDARGWLQLGLCGHQPNLAEGYISTGSLYLAATVFLPLGRALDHPFWSDPAQPWTQRSLWSTPGATIPIDHAG